MSTVKHEFIDWLEVVKEPEREYKDAVQVSVRVDAHIVEALDALARELGTSRTAVARRIIAAGVHDALDAGGLVLAFDPAWPTGWRVVGADNLPPGAAPHKRPADE